MRPCQFSRIFSAHSRTTLTVALATVVLAVVAPCSRAAILWDADAASDNWFDPLNWNTNSDSNAVIPPTQELIDEDPQTPQYQATETNINFVDGAWNSGGEGVVYFPDPSNQKFVDAQTLPFPTGYNRQTVWRLYLGNIGEVQTVPVTGLAKLTIRGNMSTGATAGASRWWIGRSSGVAGVAANALIVQEYGDVLNQSGDFEIGHINTDIPGSFGNATYDYRSGTFEQGLTSTGRLRLSSGGSTGVGGVGTWIMHNPGTDLMNGGGGHVRARELHFAGFSGENGWEPNGVTTGVGIIEYHFENGGTRAFQLQRNLVLANGDDADGLGERSSRLRLVLDEAPTVDVNGIPQDLALIDVNYDRDSTGSIIGPGAGPSSLGLTFSNADNLSEVYENGDILTAMFGASTYRWNIFYNGNIRWGTNPGDVDNSILDTAIGGGDGIEGTGTGTDIVLIGLDSIIVPEGVPGDYNDDGVVDAADYVVFRKFAGTDLNPDLPNDPNGGTIGTAQYNTWVENFGEAGAGGSGQVPEPASLMLVLAGILAVACCRQR